MVAELFPDSSIEFVTIEEFRPSAWQKLNEIRAKKYEAIVLACYDYELQRGLEKWQGYFLLTGARKKLIIDLKGNNLAVTWLKFVVCGIPKLVVEALATPFMISSISQQVDALVKNKSSSGTSAILQRPQKICYLRTDHLFGPKSGGSVTHIAGVANGFSRLGIDLFFISTDKLELVDESVTPIYIIKPRSLLKNATEVPEIVYNKLLTEKASRIIESDKPDMIYQRYSTFNYAGVILARKFRLPFVLEYNGSEVWAAKNWGSPFKYQDIAEKIELLNLRSADLIVVVSQPIKEDLLKIGLPEHRILVNPNGVDIDRLHPDIDGNPVRKKYSLEHKTIIGFIGTFGRWHGAEILAQAIEPVIDKSPNAHFLFVGDGATMPLVRSIIKETGVENHVTFTGMVPQDLGPEYLAACDILASPHVPMLTEQGSLVRLQNFSSIWLWVRLL